MACTNRDNCFKEDQGPPGAEASGLPTYVHEPKGQTQGTSLYKDVFIHTSEHTSSWRLVSYKASKGQGTWNAQISKLN